METRCIDVLIDSQKFRVHDVWQQVQSRQSMGAFEQGHASHVAVSEPSCSGFVGLASPCGVVTPIQQFIFVDRTARAWEVSSSGRKIQPRAEEFQVACYANDAATVAVSKWTAVLVYSVEKQI